MSPKHTVYKKFSHDKSVGVYMGRRDFVDHSDSVDPVDGVVLINPEQLKGKKVYVMLSCTFRYGRDDMDVLGMAFRRDVFLCTRQVYPPLQDRERCVHTRLQERLLYKLGHNAYPFFFEFPDNLPCSVGLQPAPTDVGKHCAVEFEVKAFCAENQEEKSHKRSSVRLAIRKVQYAPNKKGVVPSSETACEFMMSDRPLHMRATLEKETYYHGEPINITVDIDNGSNKDVKSITISVEQITNVVLYSSDKYVKTVAYEESTVKAEVLKEILGMLVSYRVVVKATASGMIGSSEVAVEVPFLLMHPKPEVKDSEADVDLVFEDFKRSCLRGIISDDDDSPAEP